MTSQPAHRSTGRARTAVECADLIRRRRLSPVEVVEETLAQVERLNPELNAFISVFHDQARRAAQQAEKIVMQRRRALPPLFGLPVSVKDLVLTTEAPTTAGSRIFGSGLVARQDAPVVRRLRKAGAIIIGKTNLHEVALGVTSANEHFGPVRNPHDPERVAGGSSGGSAVAVATGMGMLSVGTDTRGSVRIPAACCGIAGLKPTFGLVPVDDVVALCPSLDHVGPMARTVADCALLLETMAGSRYAGSFTRAARKPVKGMYVGISSYHVRDLDAGVQMVVESAIRALTKLGCRMSDVHIPELDPAHQASAVISATEAIDQHDQYLKTVPGAYGPLVRQRFEAAYRWTALDLLRAQETRTRLRAGFARAFKDVECLVGAVLPVVAPVIGRQTVEIDGTETPIVDAFTRLNAAQNMAGLPALSVPCGTSAGLPVGLQVIASQGDDDLVVRLGAAFERATT
jgi:aspartyl-tRNA(Asn)/glutamyl-tRNA(Gln) amidotransferase subunit A